MAETQNITDVTDLENGRPSVNKRETSHIEEKGPIDTTVLPLYKNSTTKEKSSVTSAEFDPATFEPENLDDEGPSFLGRQWEKHRIFGHLIVAGVILGWWISGLVIQKTRHRWIQSSIFAWFFILLALSRWIPWHFFSNILEKLHTTLISKPFFSLPYRARLGLGLLALTALVFCTAFANPLPGDGTGYGDRARSIFGLLVMWGGIGLFSRDIRKVQWETVIVGFSFQFVMALLVFKTGAFYSVFQWIAFLARDFLDQAQAGASFFWGATLADEGLFFISTLAAIIFFVAFVQLCYYYGIMQWLIKKFAWFFFKTMNISGVEAVVAASSPFIGQGESACLVRPYVQAMTSSEIHQTMTSGFATIAGSVLAAYIRLGMPATYLVTSSVMSIPAGIAISKLRWPETGQPLTKGRVVVARDEDGATSGLHAFSNGAWFGLRVAGLILANVLTILSLISATDGLLTWAGKSFGIHHLTLELIMGYIFYPVSWLLGVPNQDIMKVARLMGVKLIANEFVAYSDLQPMQAAGELSERGFIIAVFSLCGFANLASLGIQIGVLTSLADNQQKVITRVGPSALICGYIATLTSASIAGMLK